MNTIFCEECGSKNDVEAHFCENCGTPIEAPQFTNAHNEQPHIAQHDTTVVTPEPQETVNTASSIINNETPIAPVSNSTASVAAYSHRNKQGMNKRTLIIGICLAALATVVLVGKFVVYDRFMSPSFDLANIPVKFSLSGTNGYGKVSGSIDWDKVDTQNLTSEDYDNLRNNLTLQASKTDNLSNGDMVTFTLQLPENFTLQSMRIANNPYKIVREIDKLPKPAKSYKALPNQAKKAMFKEFNNKLENMLPSSIGNVNASIYKMFTHSTDSDLSVAVIYKIHGVNTNDDNEQSFSFYICTAQFPIANPIENDHNWYNCDTIVEDVISESQAQSNVDSTVKSLVSENYSEEKQQ